MHEEDDTVKIFHKTPKLEDFPELDTLQVTVVGQVYHEGSFEKFKKKNPLFKKDYPKDGSYIYKYVYKEAKPELIPESLKRAKEILTDLTGGEYETDHNFVEARSLATVACIVLEEVLRKDDEK